MSSVYHNLKESPFLVKINGLSLYFSSESHKNKFLENLDSFIDTERNRYSWKLKGNIIDSEDIFTLLLYKRIETRGFYVEETETGKVLLSDMKLSIVYNDTI